MDSEAVLERMVDAGLVETDGDRVFPTEAFESKRAAIREEGGGRQTPDWLTPDLVDAEHLDADLVVTAKAVAALADGLNHSEVGLVATVLDRLADPPTVGGAPDEFVPLHQEDLQGFLEQHEVSVIFVWKPESSSCEQMASTLDGLDALSVVDDTVGLGSVCVEDGADLLRERYDVAILPTTLFFVGTRVDCRAIGPRPLEHVRREIETTMDAANDADESGRQLDV